MTDGRDATTQPCISFAMDLRSHCVLNILMGEDLPSLTVFDSFTDGYHFLVGKLP